MTSRRFTPVTATHPSSDFVLLVIPCFHESGRIVPFLESLSVELASDPELNVVVVDDGSGTEEQARMRAIVEQQRLRWPALRPLMPLQSNVGKGGAVYAAWRSEPAVPLLAFVDADGSCAAYEVRRLIQEARSQPSSAIFASRVCMLGKRIERDFHRHLIGRIYATIVSEVLGILVYDSQCGLKIVPGAAFAKIQSLIEVPGFAFDVELLCLLIDSGCPVREVPIDWHETAGGKVRLLQDSFRMFRDVLAVCRRRQTDAWRAVCGANA